jgi:hypothetical protein
VTYYNTNDEEGDDLKRSRRNAGRQDVEILSLFKEHPGEGFATFQLQELLLLSLGRDYPVTSVQRSVTNLTKAGALIKTKNGVQLHAGRWHSDDHRVYWTGFSGRLSKEDLYAEAKKIISDLEKNHPELQEI